MKDSVTGKLPITVLVAAKNEAVYLPRCLAALESAERLIVADSHSTDGTGGIAIGRGAEVVQFYYWGGYPKKRQWVLETVPIDTPWVLWLGFLDGQAGTAFHFLQGFWYRYLVGAKVAEVKRYMAAHGCHARTAIEEVLEIKV